jgi:hypothetical protein
VLNHAGADALGIVADAEHMGRIGQYVRNHGGTTDVRLRLRDEPYGDEEDGSRGLSRVRRGARFVPQNDARTITPDDRAEAAVQSDLVR